MLAFLRHSYPGWRQLLLSFAIKDLVASGNHGKPACYQPKEAVKSLYIFFVGLAEASSGFRLPGTIISVQNKSRARFGNRQIPAITLTSQHNSSQW